MHPREQQDGARGRRTIINPTSAPAGAHSQNSWKGAQHAYMEEYTTSNLHPCCDMLG